MEWYLVEPRDSFAFALHIHVPTCPHDVTPNTGRTFTIIIRGGNFSLKIWREQTTWKPRHTWEDIKLYL
jgi:hypothetical protein